MNATVWLPRWLGIDATIGPGVKSNAPRCGLLRWLMPVLMMGGVTPAAPAQYEFRTEVNPDGTLTVVRGSCPTGALTIPDIIDGRKVTSIGGGAFEHCGGLTSLTIPDSVTSIGIYAFSDCISLTDVTIPTTVTMIPSSAFANCRSLTIVVIPNGVTNIGGSFAYGSGAFYGCSGLTRVTIPDTVTEIGSGAFYACSSLTNIVVPDSVIRIGDGAFWDCTRLSDAYFEGEPPSVFKWYGPPIGGPAFYAPATIHYLPGTKGWTSTFSDRPTATWVRPQPTILDFGDRFGPSPNGFSFVISWATNVPVVVDASADIGGGGWTPISTNTLKDGWGQFADPEWRNQPARFYRVRGE